MRYLSYYEEKVRLHEQGKPRLTDEELSELVDEILDVDNIFFDWSMYLHSKYKSGCDPDSSIECEECPKFDSDKCEYTKAISLAQYIYTNLMSELSDMEKMLSDVLRNMITAEGA